MTALDRLIPTLVHIQTNLDGDLRLERLADVAGWTPSHFSRSFAATVGESPRAYVERLRLERAAMLLILREASVLEIALDCGFESHETFTRAFGRRFGVPPSRWRRAPRLPEATGNPNEARRRSLIDQLQVGSLSPTTVRTLRPLPVLFRRHVGPYDQVPISGWRDVQTAAAGRGIRTGMMLGVAHDAPGLTAPARCRFDICLVVDGPVVEAWTPTGGVGAQILPGGSFAITTYVGPHQGLADAYGAIVDRVATRTPRAELVGLPAIEFYRTTLVTSEASVNETEIALPVRTRGIDPPMAREQQ